jgi:hypothetical protein
MKTLQLSFTLLSLGASLLHGQETVAKDFDRDYITGLSRREFALFQLKKRDPKLSEVDADGNLSIDDAELEKWSQKWWDSTRPAQGQQVISAETAQKVVPKEEPEAWDLKPLVLRKDFEGLTKEVGDADPASVGFFRNNLTSDDTWAVEGTLGLPMPLPFAPEGLEIGNYALESAWFVPAVGLNRITGTGDGTLEVADVLAYRAGLSVVLQGTGRAWFQMQRLTANYRYVGSTEGGNFLSAGELDWEPVRSVVGSWFNVNDAWKPLPNMELGDKRFQYRAILSGRAEGGEAEGDESFLKVGGRTGLMARSSFIPRLTLFGYYTYLWEVAGGQRDFDYLEAGLRWSLDKADQVFLEGKYRYGQLPAKYSDIDVLQLSLAVKF